MTQVIEWLSVDRIRLQMGLNVIKFELMGLVSQQGEGPFNPCFFIAV